MTDAREIRTGDVDWSAWLAGARDLEAVQAALVREIVIRQVMAESGEERRHVVDMLDAMDSMGQEAVLELTEGQPTTLHEALQRYVEDLGSEVYGVHEVAELRHLVVGDLGTLLTYPWPGARLTGDETNGLNAWMMRDGRGGPASFGSVSVEKHPDGGMVFRLPA